MQTRIVSQCRVALAMLCGASVGVIASAAPLHEPAGCEAATAPGRVPAVAAPAAGALLPPQLEIRAPLAAAPVVSMGRSYLFYELHVQSYSDEPVTVNGIQVSAAGERRDGVVLDVRMPPLQLGPRQGAVLFRCLSFEAGATLPPLLHHTALMADGAVAEGPSVRIAATATPVLAPPLAGSGWTADNGPSLESHHRIGVLVAGGQARIARRFAIDWKKYRNGRSYAGDPLDVHAYFAYGEKVFAVADGTVVAAVDGWPDNVPRTPAGFTPAVPLTLQNIGGNSVVLDLGKGQFAAYAHLQPGSVQVKPGQRVQRGQWLGRIGASGDARQPHLHFQLTDGPALLASEGLPYLIDEYWVATDAGARLRRTAEFPLGEITVDFKEERP